MKKYLLIIFILSLVFFISCGSKDSTITIKSGVVMKSGDIKNVARQEFLISNTDIVSTWGASKKEHMKDLELIEKETKAEMDYENKLNNFEKEKNRYRSILAQKTAYNNPQVVRIREDLKANFTKSNNIKSSANTFSKDIETLGKDKTSFNQIKKIIELKDQRYKYIIDLWEDTSKAVQEEWIIQYKEFKRINKLASDLDNNTKEMKNSSYKINQGISELKKELDSKAQNKLISIKNQAIDEFQLKLKENFVQSFKTNLNGEATITLGKGQYYIFGLVTVGINNIIWNLQLDVTKDTQYLELSNDNAYALADETLFDELSRALMGMGTVE